MGKTQEAVGKAKDAVKKSSTRLSWA